MPMSGDAVHRIRNFAEALWLHLEQEGIGTVHDIDTATDHLVVRMAFRHDRGHIRRVLRRLLKDHFLTDDSVVTEG
jgi:hypothetical protein